MLKWLFVDLDKANMYIFLQCNICEMISHTREPADNMVPYRCAWTSIRSSQHDHWSGLIKVESATGHMSLLKVCSSLTQSWYIILAGAWLEKIVVALTAPQMETISLSRKEAVPWLKKCRISFKTGKGNLMFLDSISHQAEPVWPLVRVYGSWCPSTFVATPRNYAPGDVFFRCPLHWFSITDIHKAHGNSGIS